jgi:hypothetical protein
MKNRIILLLLCTSLSTFLYGQQNDGQSEYAEEVKQDDVRDVSVDIGFLMGGGSLLGVDIELLIPKTQIGVQAGLGISSFGAGINYHLKKRTDSSFISFQYMYQGYGEDHYASWIGPMFVFRAKKLFQAGLGVGSLIEKGQEWTRTNTTEKARDVNAALLFNIGLYF